MSAVTVDAPLDPRQLWRSVRLPLLFGVLVVTTALALAALGSAPPRRPLDPRDPTAGGGRALAVLLRDRGVDVQASAAVPAAPAAEVTVFVPDPSSVPTTALQRLAASSADVVVVGPGKRELAALGVPATAIPVFGERTARPNCGLPAATVAGSIRYAGPLYALPRTSAATRCYGLTTAAGLVVADRGPARTIVFGSASTFGNSRLAQLGDAALALSLLGRHPQLVWLLPRPPTADTAGTGRQGVTALLPARLKWATLQLIIAVAIAALWRARRLGPVVREPLPVVVPAAETTRGRARLLRAARARGRAAELLRSAARTRLSSMLGLGAGAERAAVVATTAARSARSPAAVEAVLYGAAPEDDTALVRLAAELDDLDTAVRHG